MDTVYVITQPSGFCDWSNLWTLLSAMGTFVAVWFAVKAFRRFEYQTVKPRQIDKVIKLLNFINSLSLHLVIRSEGTIEKARFRLSDLEIESICEIDASGSRTLLTSKYINFDLFFSTHFLYHKFSNDYLECIYLPIEIRTELSKLVEYRPANKTTNFPINYICINDGDNANLDGKEQWQYSTNYHKTLKNFKDQLIITKTAIEKWLYKQGITNLNFYYYKPNKFKTIIRKYF